MLDLRFKLNPRARELPACSAVLHGIAAQYNVDGYRTTLSVKAVARGAALYTTPQARHLVTKDCFLILNEGQQYSLEFQWPTATETICPFFQPGFLEHVSFCQSAPVAKQLDDLETPQRCTGFYEHLYPRTGEVGRLLDELQSDVVADRASSEWIEDRMYELAGALARLNGSVAKDVQNVEAMRSSTRDELYRRLNRGRDFLSSCYASSVSVASAARAAKLSPAHFHRQFKALFGQTPMQFLQQRRLAAARSLLQSTDEPVTNICFMIGFESLGSFSSLFHRRFGCSPIQFRRLHCAGRKKQS
ncbi:MAG TPA: helix-turn-helix transcriptional regulator [Lacipirellulaceae bacterium]|nr:helix-turn-helix transcriptional regulator [Lacipirellulaceae bacterium]